MVNTLRYKKGDYLLISYLPPYGDKEEVVKYLGVSQHNSQFLKLRCIGRSCIMHIFRDRVIVIKRMTKKEVFLEAL